MKIENFDIVIIGGGPAGSTAAIYLARYGFKVCLIEKKKFPREILCGEFLSKEVTAIIDELNLLEKFLSLNPNPINKLVLINDNYGVLTSCFNFTAFGLKRSVFDNFLLNAASQTGVIIYQPYEVYAIKRGGGKFVVEAKNKNNSFIKIQSDFVIAAYGKQNILDKTLHRKFINKKSFLNGIKFHLPKSALINIPLNEIRIYISNGIYCGLNEVDKDTINICFLEDHHQLKKSPRQTLTDFISANKELKKIFPDNYHELINSLSIYGTGKIYFGRRNLVEDGIFMIGDAAGVIAPLAGDGIGIAMQSAKILSGILVNAKRKGLSLLDVEQRYKREWQKLFTKRIVIASTIQKIILQKKLRNAGICFVKTFPRTLSWIVETTRDNN